jgi:SAM-dependent methyltransferase
MSVSAKRRLAISDGLTLPPAVVHLIDKVQLDLSDDDGMYANNDAHYLSCGASGLNAILAAVQLANVPEPRTILDFGAGAGRVMRWLRAAYPKSQISSCDIREQDMRFCEATFGAKTWVADTDIDRLNPTEKYDLIWLGSVVTHLSAPNTMRLLEKIVFWLNPGGVAVLSFHGTRSIQIRKTPGMIDYIHDSGWDEIMSGYEETGYGYADYDGQEGYGISLTKLEWITEAVSKMSLVKLVSMAESVWDTHHDIFAVQKLAVPEVHV